MRFTVAWANVVSENLALKITAACLVVVIFALSVVVTRLSGRKPLVVERSCYSRVIATVDVDRTTSEIESFVREALAARFDTLAQVRPGYLSADEEKFRVQEQQELKKREMAQRVIVNGVTVVDKTVTVDADRLLAMGAVRSVLPFPLTVTLGTTARSEGNPYGLALLQVSAPKTDENSKGSKK